MTQDSGLKIMDRDRDEATMESFKAEPSGASEIRTLAVAWGFTAILPLPVLIATDPAGSSDVACLYLGLASAWLATEFHRFGAPASSGAWRSRMLAVGFAIAVNVAIFVTLGLAAGVRTHFPFPLMAALSAIPAVGMTPWLMRRVSNPYAAIILGALLVFAAKLVGCVVARIVYGPDYIAQGYVAGDWRTAKLMIAVLWSLSTLLSVAMLLADYRSCTRTAQDKKLCGVPD